MGLWPPEILPYPKYEVSWETTRIYSTNLEPKVVVLWVGGQNSYSGSRERLLPYKFVQAWGANSTNRFSRGRCHNMRANWLPLFPEHSDVREKDSHQGSDIFSSLYSTFNHAVVCREPRGSSRFLRTHALCLGGRGLTECIEGTID